MSLLLKWVLRPGVHRLKKSNNQEAEDEPVSLRGVAAARENGNRSLKDTTFKPN
jgi:hypothetical protein